MVIEQETLFDYLPSDARLEEALGEIFAHEFSGKTHVSISEREKNIYTSTHPSEIVKCTLPGKVERKLFLKYEIESFSEINDHRKNLDYEINIYRQVLSPIAMSTPKYYGSHTFEKHNLRLLVIEYFEDLVKFSKSKDEPNIILKAARWLGEFHNQSKKIIRQHGASFMHQYDEDYYLKWPQITVNKIIDLNLEKEFNWLLELVDQFSLQIKDLTEADPVVIHGEFYPTNVRYARGTLYPLDWQTAALSPGEIDIASLTHLWPDKRIVELTLKEYYAVRQFDEPMEKFRRRVILATIYLNFLWLRYHPNPFNKGKGSQFVDNLEELKSLL